MTPREITAAGSSNGGGDVNYLQTELSSLGIESKKRNEFNDKVELETLAAAIKEAYFQDYKIAYSNTSDREIDQSHFEHLI
jgi:hypothetical protein